MDTFSLEKLNKLYADAEENSVMRYVIEDIMDGRETAEEMASYINGVLEHGCVSGWVSSLIYYSDTTKFYEEHKEEINEMLYTLLSDVGDYNLCHMFKDWGEEDPLALDMYNQNILAWFAYEEKVYELSNVLEN